MLGHSQARLLIGSADQAHCTKHTTHSAYLGCLAGRNLLHIALDVAEHVVGVQVLREVAHHVKPVRAECGCDDESMQHQKGSLQSATCPQAQAAYPTMHLCLCYPGLAKAEACMAYSIRLFSHLSHTLMRGRASGSLASMRNALTRSAGYALDSRVTRSTSLTCGAYKVCGHRSQKLVGEDCLGMGCSPIVGHTLHLLDLRDHSQMQVRKQACAWRPGGDPAKVASTHLARAGSSLDVLVVLLRVLQYRQYAGGRLAHVPGKMCTCAPPPMQARANMRLHALKLLLPAHLRERNACPQVEVQAVVRGLALQQLNDLAAAQLLRVLLGDVDHLRFAVITRVCRSLLWPSAYLNAQHMHPCNRTPESIQAFPWEVIPGEHPPAAGSAGGWSPAAPSGTPAPIRGTGCQSTQSGPVCRHVRIRQG